MLMLQHVPDLVIGFAVVEFTENHSVGVVPSKWLANYNLTCFWPPYCAERLTASVRKCEDPRSSWTKCSVRVLDVCG